MFLTPHVAWSPPLYRLRVAALWLDNLSRFRRHLPLINQVRATCKQSCIPN